MREHGGADVRMTIRADGASDPRRYNAPTAPEIAVIMPGDGYNEQEASRDIVLHARSGYLQRITETHRAYDPLLMRSYSLEVNTAYLLRLFIDVHCLYWFSQVRMAGGLNSLTAEERVASLRWSNTTD